MSYLRPYPRENVESKKFWEGCRQDELLFQFCHVCEMTVFHPRATCPYCLGETLEWKVSEGKGKIYSFSVIHRAPSKVWEDKVPYALGIVEMNEGFFIFTEFVQIELDRLEINMPVKVVFDHVSEDLTLSKFAPMT